MNSHIARNILIVFAVALFTSVALCTATLANIFALRSCNLQVVRTHEIIAALDGVQLTAIDAEDENAVY